MPDEAALNKERNALIEEVLHSNSVKKTEFVDLETSLRDSSGEQEQDSEEVQ